MDKLRAAARVVTDSETVPRLIRTSGRNAVRCFNEFFATELKNPNTRAAYHRAFGHFCAWAEEKKYVLDRLDSVIVADFIREVGTTASPATTNLRLAAIRSLCDRFVQQKVLRFNPAASVKGPGQPVRPVRRQALDRKEIREFLDSIDLTAIGGLRDRALIGVMLYAFAEVSTAVAMDVGDYYSVGRRRWLRFAKKGGGFNTLPAHREAVLYLDAYLRESGLRKASTGPLFRSIVGRSQGVSGTRMTRVDVFRAIKRRAAAGIRTRISCRSFREAGIKAFLANGGTLQRAQSLAGLKSPMSARQFGHKESVSTSDEIDRIVI